MTSSTRSSRLGVAVDEDRSRGPVLTFVLGDRAGPSGASRGRRDRCAIPLGADPSPTCRRGETWWPPASRDRRAARPRSMVTGGLPPANGDGAGSDRDSGVAGPRRHRAPRTGWRFIPRIDRSGPVPHRLVRTARCAIRPFGERCRYRIHVASPACVVGPSAHSFRGPRSWRAGWRCGSRGAATAGCPVVSVSRAPSGGRRGERPPLAPAALEDALPSGPPPRAARLRVRLDRGARRTATRKFARDPRGARGAGDVALLLVELRARTGQRRRAREDPGRKNGTSNRRARPTTLVSRARSADGPVAPSEDDERGRRPAKGRSRPGARRPRPGYASPRPVRPACRARRDPGQRRARRRGEEPEIVASASQRRGDQDPVGEAGRTVGDRPLAGRCSSPFPRVRIGERSASERKRARPGIAGPARPGWLPGDGGAAGAPLGRATSRRVGSPRDAAHTRRPAGRRCHRPARPAAYRGRASPRRRSETWVVRCVDTIPAREPASGRCEPDHRSRSGPAADRTGPFACRGATPFAGFTSTKAAATIATCRSTWGSR